jgi:alkaline phosphatase D
VVTRREFLIGVAAATAAAGCSGSDDDDASVGATTTTTGGSTTSTTEAPPLDGRFGLGVASGDPDDTSVALWTRLLGDLGDDPIDVRWEVATDDSFGDIVASGTGIAEAAYAHSVHLVAEGLTPGTRYVYRFVTDDGASRVGRTRTTPARDDATTLRLAVASCQRYSDGFWAAYRDLAAADVDLVLFLGDFVYEASGSGVRVLPGVGATEPAIDLDGYRLRYEAARADPDLAAAAAAHPFLVTWDDHEVLNNYDGVTVDPHRRADGYQAWWEHQPTRLPPPAESGLAIHRSLRWGSTAHIVVLDCRQHREVGTTMLGAEQLAWAQGEIAGAATAWSLLGSSVVFSPVRIGEAVNPDAWDGFAAERDTLADALRAGPAAPLLLAGDVHVEVVLETPGEPPIPEVVCPSISSGVGNLGPFVDQLPALVANVEHAANVRGWLRVDLDATSATASYREVVDVADPESAVVDGPTFSFRI